MSLNKCIIMGRLTKNPELRRTNSGTPVASFTIACNRDFKDKQSGEKGVDFVDVVAWRNTAEFVCQFFQKGRMAVVEGRLQMREWTDKDGNKRRNAEIVADNIYFGDSKQNQTIDNLAETAANTFGNSVGGFATLSDDEGHPF